MVKHIVLWKLKDSADKQQNIDRMIEMLNALVGKVEGLISVEVGYNFNTSSDFDVVLYAALKNPAALKHYQFHPEHLKCKDFIGSVTVDRVAADYFFEEEAASSLPADQVADVPAAAETVLASDETDVITEPEISIEFPPKRTVIPTVTELNADKPARKTEPAEEIPSVKIPYDPSITPEIVVRRPPLWEDEVFPAQTRNTVTDQSAATPADDAFAPAAQEFNAPSDPFAASFTEPVPADDAFAPAAQEFDAPSNPFAASFTEPALADDAFAPAAQEFDAPSDPFAASFTEPVPADDAFAPAAQEFDAPSDPFAASFTEPAPKSTPDNAQVNPVSTKYSKVKEKTSIFGKKTVDVDVTPLDQRSDTWTCPNCGKIMPNYVGTCGCGEPKPFEFEPPMPSDNAPAASAVSAASVAPKAELKKEAKETPKTDTKVNARTAMPKSTPDNAQVNPVSTEYSKVKEKTSIFGKKTVDVDVTPLDQRSDTWTCPNCGKIMPNYVGTCGCGEPKPFEFEPPIPTDSDTAENTEALPDIAPGIEPKSKLTSEQMAAFENVQPSIQGYNPQLKQDIPETQGSTYSYIQNDTVNNTTDPNYQAPDLSFIQNQNETFNNDATNNLNTDQDFTAPLEPFNFGDAPEAAPMRFENNNFEPMNFDNLPPVAPMRFSDEPPAYLGIKSDPKPEASKSSQPGKSEKPAVPEYKRVPVDDFSTAKSTGKKEKKHLFGKKAKEAEVFKKAQEAVNSRKDVPNNGTWTCPNCGKVMPKYVGTCGCGEPQPFEF